MRSFPRICPTCRRTVTGQCELCDQNPREFRAPVSAPRQGSKRRAGYGRREADRRNDTVRAWVERNGWNCPGWKRAAHPAQDLTADHLDPPGLGGAEGGPLAVLCRSCNSAKQDSLPPPVTPGFVLTLIAGPPCGGKNTYLAGQAGPQDLIVDFDALAVALQPSGRSHGHVAAHKPLVCEARDAVLERLRLGGHGVRRAWVIASAPRRADRERYRHRYAARVVVVMSPEEVCLRRAMGQRPDSWAGYVRDWFAAYEPDERDELVDGFVRGV